MIIIPEVDKKTEYKIFIPIKKEVTLENLDCAHFGKIALGIKTESKTIILLRAYNPEQVAEYIKDNIINKAVTISNDNPFYQQVTTDSEPV